MIKKWCKTFIILFVFCSVFTCIDPFSPKLDKFESLLVVDALLTDVSALNYVKLTRTINTIDQNPIKVSGASVIISDDLGDSIILSEHSEGEYKTDTLLFRGEIGRSYTLNIKTIDGQEYKSEPCTMNPLQDIDTLYFGRDHELVNTESQEGIRIYIDSEGDSDCRYYRWAYEEWWKFNVPDPKRYQYINDSTFIEIREVKQTCWANKKSDEIIIQSTGVGTTNKFEKKPILFIASDESDRLLVQYCIEVKQFSISDKEYEFWDHMRQVNESGGDVFDKQPFAVSSNIYNIRKAEDLVLGYFQVSGAKVQRRYITFKEVRELGVPFYRYDCQRIEKGPVDYIAAPGMESHPPSFDDIHAGYINEGYLFICPLFDTYGDLERLAFNLPECADCTENGSLAKPDFWVDLD